MSEVDPDARRAALARPRSALLYLMRRPRFARMLVVVPPVLLGFFAFGVSLWTCPVHATSGCRCPGCGLTRSFSALARGDLAGSFELHPFALVFVAGWGLLALHLLLAPARRARLEARIGSLESRLPLSTWLMYAFLVFGATRLAYDAGVAAGWI